MNKYFYYDLRKDGLNWSNDQFNVVSNDHKEALDILGFLANTMFEKKIKDNPYKYYSETLAFKFIYQSLNLNSLLRGTHFTSKIFGIDHILFDISSSYIMQRALFENYLTFVYLYVQPKDEDERLCKWLIYKISGLNSRQDFKSNFIEYQEKIAKEKQEIEESLHDLKTNKYFLSLSINIQKEVLKKKNARLFGWQKLFESSELRSEMFVKAWKLYSNYAHSEYLSLIQFKDYKQQDESLLSMKNLLSLIALVLTTVFIKDITKLYPEINHNFNKLSDKDKDCINLLYRIAQKSEG